MGARKAEQPEPTEGEPQEHWRLLGEGNLWIRSPEEAWRKVSLSPYRKPKATAVSGEKNHGAKLEETDIPAILDLRRQGKTLRAIGVLYGIGDSQVHRIVSGQSWSHLHAAEDVSMRPARGEKHYHAKLNENTVREIRRLYRGGLSMAKIAKAIGVSIGSVEGILKGKLWKHVRDPLGPVVRRPFVGAPTPRKLDSAKVKAIREASIRGATCVEIARLFGVSATTVSAIVRRKSWKHVD